MVPLGALELQLVCHANWAGEWDETVLLPSAGVMPLLHQQLEPGVCGLLERSSRAWQEANIWLEQLQLQLQLRPVALPVCPALAPASWWQEQGLMAVAGQPTMRERLWLLLPDDLELPHAAQATLRLIRRRVSRAAARGGEALRVALARPEAAAVGQSLCRASGKARRGRLIRLRAVFNAPAQPRAGQPHSGAGAPSAGHWDVERCPAAAQGNRTEAALGEVEAQGAETGATAEAETHGDSSRVGCLWMQPNGSIMVRVASNVP